MTDLIPLAFVLVAIVLMLVCLAIGVTARREARKRRERPSPHGSVKGLGSALQDAERRRREDAQNPALERQRYPNGRPDLGPQGFRSRTFETRPVLPVSRRREAELHRDSDPSPFMVDPISPLYGSHAESRHDAPSLSSSDRCSGSSSSSYSDSGSSWSSDSSSSSSSDSSSSSSSSCD